MKIIYEDNHLLVVDKPPLLPTMGVAEGEDSLVVRAKNYLKKKYSKPGNVYLGVVSRLDSFTSGIVVFARTSKAAARLSRQFQDGSVEKRYLAIVDVVAPKRATWTDLLKKNEARHRMEVVESESQDPGAKLAKLEFSTLATSEDHRLIQINLLTGRKHQIRVQFASRGFPILGDSKYGCRAHFPKGIALLSGYLEIDHPTLARRMHFVAETPPKWPFDQVIRHYLNNLLSGKS